MNRSYFAGALTLLLLVGCCVILGNPPCYAGIPEKAKDIMGFADRGPELSKKIKAIKSLLDRDDPEASEVCFVLLQSYCEDANKLKKDWHKIARMTDLFSLLLTGISERTIKGTIDLLESIVGSDRFPGSTRVQCQAIIFAGMPEYATLDDMPARARFLIGFVNGKSEVEKNLDSVKSVAAYRMLRKMKGIEGVVRDEIRIAEEKLGKGHVRLRMLRKLLDDVGSGFGRMTPAQRQAALTEQVLEQTSQRMAEGKRIDEQAISDFWGILLQEIADVNSIRTEGTDDQKALRDLVTRHQRLLLRFLQYRRYDLVSKKQQEPLLRSETLQVRSLEGLIKDLKKELRTATN